MLRELNLKKIYTSKIENLVKEFYIPALSAAKTYDRITGFFSPQVLALASRGIAPLIKNGGQIRLITSIKVSPETLVALKAYKATVDESLDINLFTEEELQTQLEKNYFELFLILMKQGRIKVKVAALSDGEGIFHQKIGVITDPNGNSISFSGSNNETVGGWLKNSEEFKVFSNWDPYAKEFYDADAEKFNKYWNNEDADVFVSDISLAFENKILSVNRKIDEKNFEQLLEKIEFEEKSTSHKRKMRPYQEEAVDLWGKSGYHCIFAMATGSGKTFTSLNALKQFLSSKGYLKCIIAVPLLTLVEQWEVEIKSVLPSIHVISASSTNPSWRSTLRQLAQNVSLGNSSDFIVITTYSTFGTEDFRDQISRFSGEDLILLADEMHNLMTENNIATASMPEYVYKLGLSATPTRLWKPNESADVLKLFGGETYVYGLADAIRDKSLVEYMYHILPVHLSAEEFEEYTSLSREASRASHYDHHNQKEPSPLARILTKRAQIKKQAENKHLVLSGLIDALRQEGSFTNTLIYVDSNDSLRNVQKLLTEKFIKSSKFTGGEDLETRQKVIKALENRQIEAVVAIKCLDEGVDIPSAKTGIFMSNNTDPREYIQRLGRVLRKHDESGKKVANIYDFLVLPPRQIEASNSIARSLVKSEAIRAHFFQNLAKNSLDVQRELGNILDIYGFYFEPEELEEYNSSERESYE